MRFNPVEYVKWLSELIFTHRAFSSETISVSYQHSPMINRLQQKELIRLIMLIDHMNKQMPLRFPNEDVVVPFITAAELFLRHYSFNAEFTLLVQNFIAAYFIALKLTYDEQSRVKSLPHTVLIDNSSLPREPSSLLVGSSQ